jgi:hypothetical protein
MIIHALFSSAGPVAIIGNVGLVTLWRLAIRPAQMALTGRRQS